MVITARTYTGRFPGDPDQVAEARREVRIWLRGCPVSDDVVLILSELASNAVRHSLSRIGHFTVTVQLCETYVYVEVEDEGGPWYCPSGYDDGRPHGLDIIAAISGRDWGVDPVDGGRRAVWARVKYGVIR
jgi:serine/threonine-protein kinase RsbW